MVVGGIISNWENNIRNLKKNNQFIVVILNGGVRFYTAGGLEGVLKQFVVGAARYYNGDKTVLAKV